MKDLFQIQTESGQLWLDIKAKLDAKDAELAELAASHAEAIATKDAQLADQATKANLARQAAAESHTEAIAAKDAQLAELTASHTEAIAAKDAQLSTQDTEAWNETKTVARKHSAAVTELEAQHAADLAAAVEAEARAVHNRLDALVEAGQQAHAEGDLNALGRVLVSAYAHTSKARKAKLEADLASAQAAVKAAADKLAAL